MSSKRVQPPKPLRYLTITSIAMIVAGLAVSVMMVLFTIPDDTRAASVLTSRGVRTHGIISRCLDAPHDDNGDPGPTTCWVRFTPAGGSPVEAPLAFKLGTLSNGANIEVVYDPQDSGTVALPSDLGYWKTLFRNGTDVFLLLLAVAMIPLGFVGLLLRRMFGSFAKRYTDHSDEVDHAATQALGPTVAQAMARTWTQNKPSGE